MMVKYLSHKPIMTYDKQVKHVKMISDFQPVLLLKQYSELLIRFEMWGLAQRLNAIKGRVTAVCRYLNTLTKGLALPCI